MQGRLWLAAIIVLVVGCGAPQGFGAECWTDAGCEEGLRCLGVASDHQGTTGCSYRTICTRPCEWADGDSCSALGDARCLVDSGCPDSERCVPRDLEL